MGGAKLLRRLQIRNEEVVRTRSAISRKSRSSFSSSLLRLMRGPAVSVASAACQDGTSGFAGDKDLE